MKTHPVVENWQQNYPTMTAFERNMLRDFSRVVEEQRAEIARLSSMNQTLSVTLYPISGLKRHHAGHVVLVNIKEWATCRGQMGRVWCADEGNGGPGSNDPDALRWAGFTHFALLADIEIVEREMLISIYGAPLTPAEQAMLVDKYHRPAIIRSISR